MGRKEVSTPALVAVLAAILVVLGFVAWRTMFATQSTGQDLSSNVQDQAKQLKEWRDKHPVSPAGRKGF
jgi:predicted heme/steroid binding protein